jgi:AcrR family transcriptional regulator
VRYGVAQTHDERKTETRAKLLASAASLFAEHGIDAVSVDAVAEAAGRTSGAVYAHFGSKQGLLLALLDSYQETVRTILLAEVAVSETPQRQLAAVWDNVADASGDVAGQRSLLEHELWLRAARDEQVAAAFRVRNAEERQFSGRQLAGWAPTVGARLPADSEGSAVLVKALLTGLAMQRRLDPDLVTDELAVHGLSVLLGLSDEPNATPQITSTPKSTSDEATGVPS